ncbi:MAG: phytanoyl-CoA dioxygenase family protein [Saprospiraceae bacterium]|nr:phytanoyl-CoA dioxygenase family protein [Saprospiraceae bacterium]
MIDNTISSFKEQYLKDGFVSGIQVESLEKMNSIKGEVENIIAHFHNNRSALRQCHQYFQWAYDLVNNDVMLDHVEAVLGPDIFIRASMVLLKFPYSPSVVLWHSDNAYSTMGETPCVSAWIAISEVTRANGCLKVVPGSHTQTFPHHTVVNENHQLRTCLTTVEEPDEKDVAYLELDPGQMILFDPFLLHASDRSYSDVPRIGFSIRFMTPDFPSVNKKEQWVRARGLANAPKNVRFFDRIEGETLDEKYAHLEKYNLITEK